VPSERFSQLKFPNCVHRRHNEPFPHHRRRFEHPSSDSGLSVGERFPPLLENMVGRNVDCIFPEIEAPIGKEILRVEGLPSC
jgi:hypothetical protein